MRSVIFGCAVLALGGCSSVASTCLNTAVSTKIPPESMQACRQAVEGDMDRQDVYQRYMDLLRVEGQHKQVIIWSKKVLKRDKTRTDAIYNMAVGLRKIGRCAVALRFYMAYAKRNPEDPDPYYGLGLCYEELLNKMEAIEAYSTYIKMERRESQVDWANRARDRILALGGEPPTPEKATTEPPPPAPAAAAAGQAEGERPAAKPGAAMPPATPVPTGTTPPIEPEPVPAPAPVAAPAAAEDCSAHERTIRTSPFNTEAYSLFAECALKAGRHMDVVGKMRIAVRDNPDFSRAWYYMGQAYKGAGKGDEASRAFKKACAAGVAEACGK